MSGGSTPCLRVAVLACRRGEAPVPPTEAAGVLAGYLTGIERLDAYLDTFTPQEGSI